MNRTRLIGVALIALTLSPGCACFGERKGLLTRFREWKDGDNQAIPVSYPINDPNCGCNNPVSGPIISGPTLPPGSVLPMPGTGTEGPGRIPPAGIKETPGKQFETETSSKGPIIAVPGSGRK